MANIDLASRLAGGMLGGPDVAIDGRADPIVRSPRTKRQTRNTGWPGAPRGKVRWMQTIAGSSKAIGRTERHDGYR